jgi:hypothetical protein
MSLFMLWPTAERPEPLNLQLDPGTAYGPISLVINTSFLNLWA